MRLYDIVFSPTGGTQKAATLLTDALEGEVTRVDLTDSKQNFQEASLTEDDAAARTSFSVHLSEKRVIFSSTVPLNRKELCGITAGKTAIAMAIRNISGWMR